MSRRRAGRVLAPRVYRDRHRVSIRPRAAYSTSVGRRAAYSTSPEARRLVELAARAPHRGDSPVVVEQYRVRRESGFEVAELMLDAERARRGEGERLDRHGRC